jgi:hypothetical protein
VRLFSNDTAALMAAKSNPLPTVDGDEPSNSKAA